MRLVSTAALTALILLVAVCPRSEQVSSDYDPRSAPNMADWKAYAWLPHPSGKEERLDPVVAARIKLAVERALADKGYKPAFGQKPDFLVGYHAAAEAKMTSQTVNTYYTAGYGRGGPQPTGVQTQTREYDQGTLVLDIIDASTKELAWRGQAQAEIGKEDSAKKRRERLKKVLAKMLAGFPPEYEPEP